MTSKPFHLHERTYRKAAQLPQTTQVEFARRAAVLRWDADQPVMKLLSPEKLLTPVRYGAEAGLGFCAMTA